MENSIQKYSNPKKKRYKIQKCDIYFVEKILINPSYALRDIFKRPIFTS